MKTSQFAQLCFACLLGILPIATIAQPYIFSPDGSEVTDQKTGLIWRRCAEGMSWDGTSCAGVASTFTHEAALQQATTQASRSAIAWRLPNIRELSSIADKNFFNPTIDSMVFPATPSKGGPVPRSVFGSSSPNIGDPTLVWSVDFSPGIVSFQPRSTSHYVRLVRTGQ